MSASRRSNSHIASIDCYHTVSDSAAKHSPSAKCTVSGKLVLGYSYIQISSVPQYRLYLRYHENGSRMIERGGGVRDHRCPRYQTTEWKSHCRYLCQR